MGVNIDIAIHSSDNLPDLNCVNCFEKFSSSRMREMENAFLYPGAYVIMMIGHKSFHMIDQFKR